MELRKILFTNGMSNDRLLVITDASNEEINNNIKIYQENNSESNLLDLFYAANYFKILCDSEIDPLECVEVIGYDKAFDLNDSVQIGGLSDEND